MLRSRTERAFPVPLWAGMLCALLLLTQPKLARRIETLLAYSVCLPLRGLVALTPSSAVAATASTAPSAASVRYSRVMVEETEPREVPRASLGDGIVLAVVDRRSNRGGFLDELILDVRRDALAGAHAYVTCGDALIGFLSPRAVEIDDPLLGLARVELLGYRARYRMPRRVPARIALGEDTAIAMLIEPAGSIDRWPLRCALLDDPYRAAQLSAGGQAVRTSGLREDPLGVLPPDLMLGTLRVFGYRGDAGRVFPIDLLIEPILDPSGIDSVCVWFPATPPAPPSGVRSHRVPVRLRRLPVPAVDSRRFLATVQGAAPALVVGAPVLDGERLLGVCDEVGERFAVVTEFGSRETSWHLRWLPRGREGVAQVVRARAVRREGDRVLFGFEGAADLSTEGDVFTCVHSPALPAGSWLGRARRIGDSQFELHHEGLTDRDDLTVRVVEVRR